MGFSYAWNTTRECHPTTHVRALYINDLPDNIISDIFFFANDTKVLNRIECAGDAQHLPDLNKLGEWSKKWLLRFYPDKCKVLDIDLRGCYDYQLENVRLDHPNEGENLEVYIEFFFLFDTHIGNKVNKVNNILGAI